MSEGKKPSKVDIAVERAKQESERYKRDRLKASEQDAARQAAIDAGKSDEEETKPE